MVGELAAKLRLDKGDFDRGLADSEKRGGRFGGTVKKAGMLAAAGIAAAGAAAIGAAFKTAAYGDEIAKTSTKLGISTDALQEMRVWADRNGISAGSLDRAVGRLNQRIGRAADGNEKYADAFKALGVDIHDAEGNIRSTEDVMQDTIESLRGIDDAAAQSAAASEVFGTKMARDLMPALQDGSMSLEEAAKHAHELGIVMDGESLAAAERFQDSWQDIKDSVTGFLHQAGAPVMAFMADRLFPFIKDTLVPAIRQLSDWLGPKLTAAGQMAAAIFDQHVVPAVRALGEWWQANGPTIVARMQEIADFIANRLLVTFKNIAEWWQANGPEVIARVQALRDGIRNAFDTVRGIIEQAVRSWRSNTGQITSQTEGMRKTIATIFGQVRDLIAMVLADIRRTIETVTRVIQRIWERWGDDIMRYASRAWDNIMNIIDAALRFIQGLLDVVLGVLTGDWQRAWDGIKTILGAVWDAMRALLDQALNGITLALTVALDLIRDLWDAAWEWVRTKISEAWTAITTRIQDGIDQARAIIDTVMAVIREVWSRQWDIVRTALSDAWQAITDRVSSGIDSVVEFFGGLGGRLTAAFQGAWGGFWTNWTDNFTALKNFVSGRIDDIVEFFKGLPGRLLDALGNLGAKIAEKFKFKLPGISFSGEGDGPGDVGAAGGHAMTRARALATGLPLRQSSGYRSPAHNARVGGSPTSFHLDKSNPASDWVGPTWALDEFAARLKRAGGWREVLWRVPNHAPGDNPHVHVAHTGGRVTRGGIMPLRRDELDTRLQVGETVLPKGARLGSTGGLARLISAALPGRSLAGERGRAAAGPSGATVAPVVNMEARVFVGDREITDIVRVEVDERGRSDGRNLRQASRQRVSA